MRQYCLIIGTLLFTLFLFSCQQKSEYHQMVDREMATGVRQDTLFYGFYFGMPSKDFYDHCWDLNKKGWLRQGSSNQTVYAKIIELKHPASMDFYPTFHKGEIAGMPCTFAYDSWAPWNKHLAVDSLKLDVLGLMEKWYGKGFIKIKNPRKIKLTGDAYVKVDGNRRISIYNKDDSKVHVDFLDLTKKEEIEQLVEDVIQKSKDQAPDKGLGKK